MLKRRGFLGGLLATPLATAAAAKDAAIKQLGASGIYTGAESFTPDGPPDEIFRSGSTRPDQPWYITRRLRLEAIKLFNRGYLEEKARREAKYVRNIDPDIMALQSVSLAGKIFMQRKRQFEKEMDIDSMIEETYFREREERLVREL